MKKILLFLTFLLFPVVVYAVDYEVEQYYVDAQINLSGDLNVKELMVINGTLNGYENRFYYKNTALPDWNPGNIDFANSSIYNAGTVVDMVIKGMKTNKTIDFNSFNDVDFEIFKEVDFASNGESGVYEHSSLAAGEKYRIYFPIDNGRIVIYSSYTVTSAVVIHTDVAEIYWTFISEDLEDAIEDVKIRLTLPNYDELDNAKLWAHGPIGGNISRIEEEGKFYGAYAEIEDMSAMSSLDIRMTFSKDLIMLQDALNHSEEEALPKILEVEQIRADERNREITLIKATFNGLLVASIVYLVGIVLLWIYVYIKFDKEHRSDFKAKYYREFIEDYNVEVVDYLINHYITPNAMSASIMNLIYKKNIKVETLDTKNKEYKFTFINAKNVTETEKFLIEFLFNDVGDKKVFTTKDLKAYSNKTATATIFTEKYGNWKNKVKNDAVSQQFYETNSKVKFIGIIYFIVGGIITFLAYHFQAEVVTAYICAVAGFIFMLYTLLLKKKTKKGNEHYRKWMAFKNFLLDFSILPKRELPEIKIWERYMVYATVLGVAEQVLKTMNVIINEYSADMATSYSPTFDMYLHMHLYRTLNTSVSYAVNQSIATVSAANASASMASGSGGGGGFSSGGGFGGGGRGGGGF